MPISAITTTSAPNPATQTKAEQALSLGKDAFMKMMLESLRQQDPNSASDNKEFVQQLSQMTTLEQITNMANATTSLAGEMRDSNAISMIGKTVSWLDKDGARQQGAVDSVQRIDGSSMLMVGGMPVDPTKVVDVR